MSLHRNLVHYSPREAGGGGPSPGGGAATAVEEEGGLGDRKPRMIRVGEEEITEEEAVRDYKGRKATTEAFQKAATLRKQADERMALAERRLQEVEERERKLNATRDDLLMRERKPDAGEERPRPRLRERIKEIDFIGSEDAGERLGSLFDEEWSARETELATRYDQSLAKQRQELQADLKKVRDEAVASAARPVAQDRVERQNRETLERVLEAEFGDVKITAQERESVQRKYRQKLGPDYGSWNAEANAWLASDEAVIDAVWSTPALRERLIKAQTAKARGDGLTARERGERATESTPGRPARPVSSDPDQALLQKYTDLRDAVQHGTMSDEQAMRSLTLKEAQRIRELRNAEINRQRAAAG